MKKFESSLKNWFGKFKKIKIHSKTFIFIYELIFCRKPGIPEIERSRSNFLHNPFSKHGYFFSIYARIFFKIPDPESRPGFHDFWIYPGLRSLRWRSFLSLWSLNFSYYFSLILLLLQLFFTTYNYNKKVVVTT